MADLFKLNVDDRALQRKLAQLEKIDTIELHRTIGAALLTLVGLSFRMSRDPWGAPWKPLKQRRGQPLVDSGRLRASLTSEVASDRVSVGTNLIYAPPHQFGATIVPVRAKMLAWQVGNAWHFAKRVTIPPRPFLPIGANGQVNMPPIWERAIIDRVRGFIDAQIA